VPRQSTTPELHGAVLVNRTPDDRHEESAPQPHRHSQYTFSSFEPMNGRKRFLRFEALFGLRTA
jgi:hypothetical protein